LCETDGRLREDRAKLVEESSSPQVGKRVVEITQPARRPARLERMLTQREGDDKPAETPAATTEEGTATPEGGDPAAKTAEA